MEECMSDAPVLFHTLPCANGSAIGVATLNSAPTLNALSLDMIVLLRAQLQAWEADPAIAMILLQGSGDKAFCAGGDLQQLYRAMRVHHQSPQHGDVLANTYAVEFFTQEYALDYLIHTCPKPVLCWGHGIVMGGGIGLMAGASHRVVTEGSRLAMPEVAIGLYPDVGGSWFLNRMPGRSGLFLALTGASLNADDALFVKLADYRLEHASKTALLARLQGLDWSAQAGDSHRSLSAQLLQMQSETPASVAGPLRQHLALIDDLCGGTGVESIVERIAGLESDDRWLQKAVAALRKGSPGAAWLAYTIQRKCRHLSLLEVFKLELGVSLACAAGHDFAEGIRALIVDKDQQPRWQPATLQEVPPSWEGQFFTSPWPSQDHPLNQLAERKAA
jgi:enoyl-CoA hydratase/carnithine racemase